MDSRALPELFLFVDRDLIFKFLCRDRGWGHLVLQPADVTYKLCVFLIDYGQIISLEAGVISDKCDENKTAGQLGKLIKIKL